MRALIFTLLTTFVVATIAGSYLYETFQHVSLALAGLGAS